MQFLMGFFVFFLRNKLPVVMGCWDLLIRNNLNRSKLWERHGWEAGKQKV